MTKSPLVAAYLADLDRALAGAYPADRLEIVDAVREHIDAAVVELGASPTQAEIAGVLRRLGTADDVAAAWAVGADRPVPLVPRSVVPRVPPGAGGSARTSPWIVALVVILGAAVLGPLLGALLLIPVSGALVPFVWRILGVVLILAITVGCAVAWRRAATHRTAWLVSFVVGLVLLVPALGAAVFATGSLRTDVPVVEVDTPATAPTPSPAPGLP